MRGYGENPRYMQGEFGWTPDFKDEHAWCTWAVDAWPDGLALPDETPAVVTVLLHRDMLDYTFDANGKISGVIATGKLRALAEEQGRKQ